MKSKEDLAKEYAENWEEITGLDFEDTVPVQASVIDFLAGFKAGQPKWISVKDQLPNDDRTVLVWVDNLQYPQWSNYKLAAYINKNWYCNSGRETHEIVTDWCDIPARK